GVSSTGTQGLKAVNSNYGLGIADIGAPGGDSILQPSADGGGRVLSTWPAKLMDACTRRETVSTNDPEEPTAVYCYQQGTSMAAAHVSGVAALVLSRSSNSFGESRGWRGSYGGALQSLLDASADPIACPSADVLALYALFAAL